MKRSSECIGYKCLSCLLLRDSLISVNLLHLVLDLCILFLLIQPGVDHAVQSGNSIATDANPALPHNNEGFISDTFKNPYIFYISS